MMEHTNKEILDMKHTLTALVLTTLAAVTLAPSTSHAIFEVRANYGLQVVDPKVATNYPSLSQLTGYGLDGIVSLPLFPLAFGMRYEQLGFNESNSVAELDVNLDRVSALVSVRIIDTLLFIGGIGTLGLNHTGSQMINDKTNNNLDVSEDVDVDVSFTLGLEAGVKIAGLLLGGEAGYSSMTIKNSSSSQEDLELNGAYLKAHVGINF
jgi:hypothetical protein